MLGVALTTAATGSETAVRVCAPALTGGVPRCDVGLFSSCARLTRSGRPWKSYSARLRSAFIAVSASWYSIKAKPLRRPVSRSFMIRMLTVGPIWFISAPISSSLPSWLMLPTKMVRDALFIEAMGTNSRPGKIAIIRVTEHELTVAPELYQCPVAKHKHEINLSVHTHTHLGQPVHRQIRGMVHALWTSIGGGSRYPSQCAIRNDVSLCFSGLCTLHALGFTS